MSPRGLPHGKPPYFASSHDDEIVVEGASTNNLKHLDCVIPRGKLVGVTGPSGSGKSSLVFGTLWREARRRLVGPLVATQEALLEPAAPVRAIRGLSYPVALLAGRPARSLVPALWNVLDVLPALEYLYLDHGVAHCVSCDAPVQETTREQILSEVVETGIDEVAVLARASGVRKALAERFLSLGFTRAFDDGLLIALESVDGGDTEGTLDIVIDALRPATASFRQRFLEALELAGRHAPLAVVRALDAERPFERIHSEQPICPSCGHAQRPAGAHSYKHFLRASACPLCLGAGVVGMFQELRAVEPALALLRGGIRPWRTRSLLPDAASIDRLKKALRLKSSTTFAGLSSEKRALLFYGKRGERPFSIYGLRSLNDSGDLVEEGLAGALARLRRERGSLSVERITDALFVKELCSACRGARVLPEAARRRYRGKRFEELARAELAEVQSVLRDAAEDEREEAARARLRAAVGALVRLGTGYLSLGRAAATLSGGEYQRAELSRELRSPALGLLYLIDEPSVGLHPLDVRSFADSLEELRTRDATVVLVDHQRELLKRCDTILELGPGGGTDGGTLQFSGRTEKWLSALESKRVLPAPHEHSPTGEWLLARGLSKNNLRIAELRFPTRALIGVCGVSGSGKSSALLESIAPAVERALELPDGRLDEDTARSLQLEAIENVSTVERVVVLKSFSMFRGPRSTVASASGLLALIRRTFALSLDAKLRGLSAESFVGRHRAQKCLVCEGRGFEKTVTGALETCVSCEGTGLAEELLRIKARGRTLPEVLSLTVAEAERVFAAVPRLGSGLAALGRLGLGYLTLSQRTRTLSTGEQQRLRLFTELSKTRSAPTLVILDEPSRGLHEGEIVSLLGLLRDLVSAGHTVICIEHRLELLECMDYLIELGPGAGPEGGKLIAQGTVSEMREMRGSIIGPLLSQSAAR